MLLGGPRIFIFIDFFIFGVYTYMGLGMAFQVSQKFYKSININQNFLL